MSSEYITEYRKLKRNFIIMLSVTVFFLALCIIALIDSVIKNTFSFETILAFFYIMGLPWGIWYSVKNWRLGRTAVFIGFFFGIFILPYGIYKYVTSLKELSGMIKADNNEPAETAQKEPDESLA